MTNLEVVRYRDRLDHLFKQASFFEREPEMLAHWARYLCVLCSGFLEVAVRAILAEYARGKANPLVANYVEAQLSRFQNPAMGNILDLTGRFSPEWRGRLEQESAGEPADAVNSIVANRHPIAHGQNVGISYHAIRRYYESAITVVELLDELCQT